MTIEDLTKYYGALEKQEKILEEYIKAVDDYIYKSCGLIFIAKREKEKNERS